MPSLCAMMSEEAGHLNGAIEDLRVQLAEQWKRAEEAEAEIVNREAAWAEEVRHLKAAHAATIEKARQEERAKPILMVLRCPYCTAYHVDEGEWAARPHRTHLCALCGKTWRPANVPTVGVAELPLEASDDAPTS